MSEDASVNGVEKAAIFLMSVGEGVAGEVIKHLGPREVQKIGAAMSALQNVSREMVSGTLGDFAEAVRQQTGIGIGSEEYIRTVLTNALGEEKATSMIDRILLGGASNGSDPEGSPQN